MHVSEAQGMFWPPNVQKSLRHNVQDMFGRQLRHNSQDMFGR